MPESEFLSWQQGEQQKLQTGTQSVADKGKALFESAGCLGCHSVDGSAKVGPTLKGIFGSRVELADGKTLQADEEYLRESLVDPNAKVVKGFQPIMPTFKGTLKDDDIAAIIAYMKTLK
jgi:cytochrome c oxidase subunit II